MGQVTLRPYQQEAVQQVISEWDAGHLHTLLVLPTGCGKTICFAKITEEEVRKGNRVLILAHRAELLDQAADKLHRSVHLKAAKEKAEESALGSWYRVTIGSVQSLCRPKRLEKFEPDYYDTIIIDEAHHALSSSYQTILEYFKDARVLGVTATPERGDHKNLGEFFESIAYEYRQLKKGICARLRRRQSLSGWISPEWPCKTEITLPVPWGLRLTRTWTRSRRK